MNVGSLFSGIGGFDLGLERAGMRVAWQCEADEFCQRVLARHWPGVPCYPDVRELTEAAVEPVDVLCGGFPCQDISTAGRAAGINGARSGLWGEYARLIGELRPSYVLVENVPVLRSRGFGRVLGDLAALGYDAEWDCLPASAFGARHRRDRLWVVAYPTDPLRRSFSRSLAGREAACEEETRAGAVCKGDGCSGDDGSSAGGQPFARLYGNVWTLEPDMDRMVDGASARMDRLAALGNALVPQIAEWLGTQILDYERGRL